MRYLQISFLLCVVAFATGCPQPPYAPKVDFNNAGSFIGKLNAKIGAKQQKCECYRMLKDYTEPATDKPFGSCGTGSKADGKELAKDERNELIEEVLPYINYSYTAFVSDLDAGRARNNYLFDVIELGTSAAIGFTNGQRPVQIMGIALTAFRGGRRSMDANFYRDQSIPILKHKMDDNRAKMREFILNREKDSIDDYRVGTAIGDIVDYYNAGTLIEAFSELAKDTAAQAKASEDSVRRVRGPLDVTNNRTAPQIADAVAILEHKKTLERQIIAAEAPPDPAPANPLAPTAAETQAITDAQTARGVRLEPIRLKLEVMWKGFQADDKYAAAIAKVNTDPAAALIVSNIGATPATVPVRKYLYALYRLIAAIKDDAALTKDLRETLDKSNK